ncbi:MFS transporter [Vagococcus carniphilus]|uniref:MFS transporter n=1 Tax=Vagococcus carniphilus TaxID=218144 RepID=UPI00288D8557|nr:MFS transporter [Vagococcus carniphilus]MDT2866116.1 MFS transporter [Vagococcus carniphilus]
MNQLTKKEWLRLSIIFLPNLMISLNTYMLQVALPEIQKTLGITFSDAQFILTGYSLGLATFLILSSFFGNRWGQKNILLLGISFFFVLSIIGGITSSETVLILVRIGQGISGALIQPQVMVLMREGFSKDQQPFIFSLYGMVIGLGFTFGLLLGGIIMKLNLFNLGWRNIFFFNLPVCLLILCMSSLIPKREPITKDSVDVKGSSLLVLGSFLLVYQIIYFKNITSVVIILIGLALLFFFRKVEKVRLNKKQTVLVDFSIFQEPNFLRGIASVFCVYMSMFGLFFLMTYYAQLGLGKSVFQTGFIFLPLGIGFTLASIASANWLKKMGNQLLLLGVLGMLGSLIILMFSLKNQPDLFTFFNLFLLFLYGLFLGITTTPLIGIILIDVSTEFSGLASSIINMVMYFSNIMGVALIGGAFKKIAGQTNNYLFGFSYSLTGVLLCLVLTGYYFKITFIEEKKRSSSI